MNGSTIYSGISLTGLVLLASLWHGLSTEAPPVPEIVPLAERLSEFDSAGKPLESGEDILFTDKTFLSGISHRHTQKKDKISSFEDSLGAGVCAADFNNDGWDDLFFVSGSGNHRHFGKDIWWQDAIPNQIYMNVSGQHFLNVTGTIDIKQSYFGIACATADLNADGWVDIVVAAKGANLIYENLAGRNFRLHEAAFTPEPSLFSTSILIRDFNNDGQKDVLFGNYVTFVQEQNVLELNAGFDTQKNINFDPALYDAQPDTLFINKGNFSFTLTPDVFEPNKHGRTLGFFEHNGHIIALNDKGSPSQLISRAFEKTSFKSIVISARDAERIHSPGANQEELLLFSDAVKGGVFAFTIHHSQINDKSWDFAINDEHRTFANTWSILAADFNLDNTEDLFLANGGLMVHPDTVQTSVGQNNIILKADAQSRKFREQPQRNMRVLSARGGATLDFNLDGKIDVILANNNEYPSLLINASKTASNWVGVKCIPQDECLRFSISVNGKIFSEPFVAKQAFASQSAPNFVAPVMGEKDAEVAILDGKKAIATSTIKNNYLMYDAATGQLSPVTKKATEQTNIAAATEEYFYLLGGEDHLPRATELENVLQDVPDDLKLDILAAIGKANNRQFFQLPDHWSTSENPMVALAAIDILRDLEVEQTIPRLIHLMDSKDDKVACRAIKAFEYFYWKDEATTERKNWAESALIKVLYGASAKRASCAIDALAESESYRALAPLIKFLHSDDDYLAMKAARALGMLRQVQAVADLQRTVSSHKSPFVRAESLVALIRLAVNPENIRVADIPKANDSLFNNALVYTLQNSDDGVIINPLVIDLLKKHSTAKFQLFSYLSTEQLFHLYRILADKPTIEINGKDVLQVLSIDDYASLVTPQYAPLIASLSDSEKFELMEKVSEEKLINLLEHKSPSLKALCNFNNRSALHPRCAAVHKQSDITATQLSDLLRGTLNMGRYEDAKWISLAHRDIGSYGVAINQLLEDNRLQTTERLYVMINLVIKRENLTIIQRELVNLNESQQLQILRNVQQYLPPEIFKEWAKRYIASSDAQSLRFFSMNLTNPINNGALANE